jgi:hypothetical protein
MDAQLSAALIWSVTGEFEGSIKWNEASEKPSESLKEAAV